MGMELEGVGEPLRFIPEVEVGGMYSVQFYSVFAFFWGGMGWDSMCRIVAKSR